MGFPLKAVKECDLQSVTHDTALDGAHQIFRASFINEQGKRVSGFVKKLEPLNHFPEFLAKLSVAASVFSRVVLGNNAAEERLILNDREEIVGVFSIEIEGFKPLNYKSEAVPADKVQRERVIPSTQTLILANAIETLLVRWFLHDDDIHPHNIGLIVNELGQILGLGSIDHDMFFYWLTILIKGQRPTIPLPPLHPPLFMEDWASFPHTSKAGNYHWATYQSPGEATRLGIVPGMMLPKAYAEPEQFKALAANKEAQEQKLAASIKILLTLETAKTRLREYFGDISVNFTSLDKIDPTLRQRYESQFRAHFRPSDNSSSFADWIIGIYQKHYDYLYRMVVFYMGTSNNGFKLPLPATCHALYMKPSIYKNITAWAQVQNTQHLQLDSEDTRYNLELLEKRYHQIWRDAFANQFKQILNDQYLLNNRVLEVVSSLVPVMLPGLNGMEATNPSLTHASEFFGPKPNLTVDQVAGLIHVEPRSPLSQALPQLIIFTNELYRIITDYYAIQCCDLTAAHNTQFVEAISALLTSYSIIIREKLSHTTSNANSFTDIELALKRTIEQANFRRHLTTTDEQMQSMEPHHPQKLMSHLHEETIKSFIDALFNWANTTSPSNLTSIITSIVDTKYAPTLPVASFRARAEPVKRYLLASEGMEDGAQRLAYILSSGSRDDGALNILLIKHLLLHALPSSNLPSIQDALDNRRFVEADYMPYTTAVVQSAKKAARFNHLATEEGRLLFFKALFDFADGLCEREFRGIVDSAVTAYESQKSTWWFASASRRPEVEGFVTKYKASVALAMIFTKGEDTSTLSKILFNKMVEQAKKCDCRSGDRGLQLIQLYCHEEHEVHFLPKLKSYSQGRTHELHDAQRAVAQAL